MNKYGAVKTFIQEQNYKGDITEKGSTAEQNFKRLNEAVNILEQNGITEPTEADFDNILRPAIAAKGKRQGSKLNLKLYSVLLALQENFITGINRKEIFK